MMNHDAFLDVSDAPYFTHDGKPAPDYRAEAFEQAKEMAKKFCIAFVMYNGLYYHVTSSSISVSLWMSKGYKVIHTEFSEAMKRTLEMEKGEPACKTI